MIDPIEPRALLSTELLTEGRNGPCISIYLPTHPTHPDRRQDPIRFRNLVDRVEESIARADGALDAGTALQRLRELQREDEFWNHTSDGLAVFAGPGVFHALRLARPVPELAIVADSFHVKPLLRATQSSTRYRVLAIGRESAKIYEGDRDSLEELRVEAWPATSEAALGSETHEPRSHTFSYGTGPSAAGAGSNRGAGGAKTGGMRHGHGERSDLIDERVERYFRAVDHALPVPQQGPVPPLIIAALGRHQATFRSVSRYPNLLTHGIETDPSSMDLPTMRDRAWKLVEPTWAAHVENVRQRFGQAVAAARASTDLADIARLTVEGRIETVLLEAGRVEPGRIDADGQVRRGDLDDPDTDDLLDEIGEHALRTGAEVLVLDAGSMPTGTGAAAILRY